jgi:hypothetical protein
VLPRLLTPHRLLRGAHARVEHDLPRGQLHAQRLEHALAREPRSLGLGRGALQQRLALARDLAARGGRHVGRPLLRHRLELALEGLDLRCRARACARLGLPQRALDFGHHRVPQRDALGGRGAAAARAGRWRARRAAASAAAGALLLQREQLLLERLEPRVNLLHLCLQRVHTQPLALRLRAPRLGGRLGRRQALAQRRRLGRRGRRLLVRALRAPL